MTSDRPGRYPPPALAIPRLDRSLEEASASASVRGRTAADVLLEVEQVRSEPPTLTAQRLRSEATRLRNRRSEVVLQSWLFARAVDRAAVVHGAAWVLEALELDSEDAILELVSVPDGWKPE